MFWVRQFFLSDRICRTIFRFKNEKIYSILFKKLNFNKLRENIFEQFY